MILNIETSKSVCSVALSSEDKIIAQKVSYDNNSHSKVLATFIDEIFKEQNIKPQQLKAVAVSEGPGSYTGLRIGTSIAKGLAYSLNIPMIAIDTLKIMCVNLLENFNQEITSDIIFCPMIDARRMEVYTAFYDYQFNKISEISNLIIDELSFKTALQYKRMIFFGDGAEKCKSTIVHQNAVFVDKIFPLAENMIKLSLEKFNNNDFVDVAYFEPFYLKPFIATVPKDKLR